MLKKLLLSVVLIGISFVTGYATAQSYFNNKMPAPLAVASTSNDVLSPSDFQSQTQQMQEKKNQALSDQLKEDLAKIPPTTPPPPPHTPNTPSAGQEAAPGSNPAPGTNPSTEATAPTNQTPAQEAAPSASGAAPAAPPTTAPGQSQVYTGFQNQNQDQNQSQSPTPGASQSQQPSSSDGWNIKY